ncbi:MAG: HAD family phosphatase [Clostridia bacterium]|nr:HAD family phosphatase [Clostridia bacterium]
MNSYALFLDIDRTLTGRDHIIPQRNIEAIKRARSLGHKVFINTGRSYGNIPPEIFKQIEVDGILSGNGTMITIGGETVFERFMPEETAARLAEYYFDNENLWAAFEGKRRSYSIPGRPRELTDLETPVTDFEDYLLKTRDDNIQVIAASAETDRDFLDSFGGLTYFAFDRYYDIVAAGNNKSVSMAMTLDIIGIPRERSIAFGDSENDLEMLRSAGTGVAVSNAQPKLLSQADFVSLSNTEGGVGYAIEELLLKNKV